MGGALFSNLRTFRFRRLVLRGRRRKDDRRGWSRPWPCSTTGFRSSTGLGHGVLGRSVCLKACRRSFRRYTWPRLRRIFRLCRYLRVLWLRWRWRHPCYTLAFRRELRLLRGHILCLLMGPLLAVLGREEYFRLVIVVEVDKGAARF